MAHLNLDAKSATHCRHFVLFIVVTYLCEKLFRSTYETQVSGFNMIHWKQKITISFSGTFVSISLFVLFTTYQSLGDVSHTLQILKELLTSLFLSASCMLQQTAPKLYYMSSLTTQSVSSDFDTPELEQEYKEVILHYHNLCSTIASILPKSNSANADRVLTPEIHEQLQQAANGFGKYLSSHLARKYYNEIRSDESTIANKTFNIPELLELILQHADHTDIVRIAQVSRNIKSIIQASTKLQVRLYLKATSPSAFQENEYDNVFKSDYPGLRVRTAKYDGRTWNLIYAHAPGNEGLVQAQFFQAGKERFLPRIGTTFRKMLICQPPAYHMTVESYCCTHRIIEEEISPVHSNTGLTVGDLYDQASQILMSPSCPLSKSFGSTTDFRKHPCEILYIEFKSYDPVLYELEKA